MIDIDKLEQLAKAATPGEWSLPHFADKEVRDKAGGTDKPCGCGFVLSESYMGAICTVHYAQGKNEGDDPPLEEAKANARHIHANQPRAILALIAELHKLREFVQWAHDEADNSCARRCRETGKRHKNDPWAASFDAIRTKARAALKDTPS